MMPLQSELKFFKN